MNCTLSPGTSDLFVVDASRLPLFGDLISDFNPLHRDKDVAKSRGFQNTPVYAVWLEAKAEEYLRTHNLTEGMGSQPLIYTGHSFKFKKEVYPEQCITFNRGERKLVPSGVKVRISASNDSGVQVLDSEASFGRAYSKFEEPLRNLVHVKFNEFSYEDHRAFHYLIAQPDRTNISHIHIASCIPATLLEKAFLQTNEEKPALSRSIDLKFHGIPQIRTVRTEIYLSSVARNLGPLGWLYNVLGVCYQGEEAILTGRMNVIYPDKFLTFAD